MVAKVSQVRTTKAIKKVSAKAFLSEVEWDPLQFEGRKVVVRVDATGEPCAYEKTQYSIFKAYFFVCWRSFDDLNHREYAECVAAPMNPKQILSRLECDVGQRESRRSGDKFMMIPVNAVYFINPEDAKCVGVDPHPEQDLFFPERMQTLGEAISQPSVLSVEPFPDSERVMVGNRPTGRIALDTLCRVPVLGKGLELRMSRIPSAGRGVYATREFQANELVTLYFGHVFGEVQRRHMQARAMGTHSKPVQFKLSYLDGVKEAFEGMPAGQLLNEGTKTFQNCDWITLEVFPSSGERVVGIRALRRVFVGEELYVSYGQKFWSEQGEIPADPPPLVFRPC